MATPSKNTLQSHARSDTMPISTPSALTVETVLEAQLRQWESMKRHAERQIADIRKELEAMRQ
jgi:hypothetical protein